MKLPNIIDYDNNRYINDYKIIYYTEVNHMTECIKFWPFYKTKWEILYNN